MQSITNLPNASISAAGESYRLAPVLLARVPLLRIAEAETNAWDEARDLLVAKRRMWNGLQRFVPSVLSRIAEDAQDHPRPRRQWRELRRAVRCGVRPSAAILRVLQDTRSARIVAWAWQRLDGLDARLADALARTERREADELAVLANRPEWGRALKTAHPDVALQFERVLQRSRLARRDRVTLRTVRRLAWRAAGRPAPMGLFSGTARMRDSDRSAIDQVAEAPRQVRVAIRTQILGEMVAADTVAPPAEAESLAWEATLSGMAGLDFGIAASRLRECAEAIESGSKAMTPSAQDARALWIESVLGSDLEIHFGGFEAGFDTISRLGSRLVDPAASSAWTAGIGLPSQGRMPLDRLIEIARDSLHARHGEVTTAAMPISSLLNRDGRCSHPADCVVEEAIENGSAIRADEVAELGIPAPQPLRAAFRARPLVGTAGNTLAISHWGGNVMSVLMGYAHLVDDGSPSAAVQLREWVAEFPGSADVAFGSTGIADRQRRLAPRRVTDFPRGPGDIAIDDLVAEWDANGLRLLPMNGPPIVAAIHPGLTAEEKLPFAARLLLHLVRQPRTMIEILIESANRALAGRIAAWLSEAAAGAGAGAVLKLPAVAVEPGVVLAPPAFVLRTAEGPHEWEVIAAAWDELQRSGCRLGLAEMRVPGSLADPRIVDLGSRDGIALALGGGAAFTHLTPLAPAPESRWFAEFCIELAAQ